MNYYREQLKELKDSEYFKSIIVFDGLGNKTKTMDLNRESIPVLMRWLSTELEKLPRVTKVAFRMFPQGDVIALFLDEVADPRGNIESYQHIGQHGTASPELVDELRPATKEEYQSLLTELKSLGYILEVIK